MDTHAEFRDSERATLPLRFAVVIGVLALGVGTGADPLAVAALGGGFAFYTGVLQFALLPRFQSDAWIFGMIGADAAFTGLAAAALGLPGPVIAIPVLFAGQHALFLGYRGAGVSAFLGIAAVTGGGVIAGSDVSLAISTTIPLIAGVAALSGYIASGRFAERSMRRKTERNNYSNSRAARMLDGLRPVASAGDETTALEAFARSILTVTGFDAVAVYTRSGGLGFQQRVILSRDGEDNPAGHTTGAFEESMHGDSAAARAAAQGVALAIGPGGSPSEQMPAWATQMGFSSGVVAPMIAGHLTVGVAFGLSREEAGATLARIEDMEQFVSLSSRLVAAHNSGMQPAARNRLSLELDAAGRAGIGEARPIIKMDGLVLDPATDRSSVAGVPVSLSRSEFDLLYALARSPGEVVDPGSLVQSAFGQAPDSGGRTVDATIYRLRRKLSRAPAGDDLVRTVRGKGYLLTPPAIGSESVQESAAITAD
ncbi:MAG: winged helix-turn-helix domain-containing protein [Dehalococcoidia bacterium]|jgi:DNA-binding winged helix-turn-helix (wHTH) protein|nr:winged helix-turn-helix domain-containing protein [Dehalococcoidia bacterium]